MAKEQQYFDEFIPMDENDFYFPDIEEVPDYPEDLEQSNNFNLGLPTFETEEAAKAYAKEQENLAKQSNTSKNVDVNLSQNISSNTTDTVKIMEKVKVENKNDILSQNIPLNTTETVKIKDVEKQEVENKSDLDLVLTNRDYWYKDFKDVTFTKAKVSLKGDLTKIHTKIQANERFYTILLKANKDSDFTNSILLKIKATPENTYLADLHEKFLQGQKPFAVNLKYDLSIENKDNNIKINEKNFVLNYDENLLQIPQEQEVQVENTNFEQIVDDEIIKMEKIIQKYKNSKDKFIANNDSIYKVLQKNFNNEFNKIGSNEKILLDFVTKYYTELISFSQEQNTIFNFFKNLINPKAANLCCILKNKNAKNIFNLKLNLIETFIHSKINKDKMIQLNQREQNFSKLFNKNNNNNYSQIAKIFNDLENKEKKNPNAKQNIDFKDMFDLAKSKLRPNLKNAATNNSQIKKNKNLEQNTKFDKLMQKNDKKSISKVVQENLNLDKISLKSRNYGILGASIAGIGALLASVSNPITVSIIAGLGALTAISSRFGIPYALEKRFLTKNKDLNQALKDFFNNKNNNNQIIKNNQNNELDDLIKQLDAIKQPSLA